MTTGKALNGKPYARNPHVRFDEGEVASAATPRRGSLLYSCKSLKFLQFVASAALCAAAALPSHAEAKSATLACFGYSGKTEIHNFQALVKLTGSNYGFSYDDYSLRDGSDLWFTDSAGNLIPHEIDTWNPDGDSFVWVKIPTLADHKTRIVMHWGEERTAEQISSESVWPGFAGVWHMGKTVSGAPVTPTEQDATGHGLDAVASGVDAAAVAAMTEAGGVVGNARNNALNNGLQVPDFRSHIADETKFAISGWWKGTGDRRFFSARGNPSEGTINNYWELYGGLNSMTVAFGNGTTFQDKQDLRYNKDYFRYIGNTSTDWTYVTVAYEGKTATLYVGGKAVATFTASVSNVAPEWGLKIGNIVNAHGWVGSYDEVRMFDGVPSADRVAADYATMNDPTAFLTLPGTGEISDAAWTGGGNDNDFTNPQNWNCTDLLGVRIEGAVPNERTFVTISGDALGLQMPSGFSQAYRLISIGDCTLAADCDWRGLTNFTIDGTVNLNGRKLYVNALGGAGTITDDVAAGELVTDGSFEDITTAIPYKGTNGSLGYYEGFNTKGAPQLRQWTVSDKTNCGLVKPVGGETTSPWVSVDSAPDGENVVFFQHNRTFSQQISVPSAGRYIVSFWYTTRWDCRSDCNTKDYSGARIAVEIGGETVGEVLCRECVSATAEKPFKKFCVEADLVAGTQTLAVRAVLPSGVSSTDTYNGLIDAVSVRPAGVGELHLDSASAVANSTVTLAGTLKFVKEGSGAFTAAKADQFYAGGTEIRQGTVKLALDGQSAGKRFPFGAENGSIVVSTNGAAKGVFDMDGTSGTVKDCTRYRFVLNGGVIQNTGRDMDSSHSQLKHVRLAADSEWRADRNFGLLDFYSGRSSDQQTTLDLNGHVLSMRFATGIYFLVRNATVLTGDGGAIEVTGDGFFSPRTGTSGVNAADLDLDVAYRLRLQDSLSVHDYTAKYAGTYGDGSSALNVGGTFKPTVDRFYGPTMQDGSTIDLTAWPTTAGWPVCSQYTLGPTNISFAAGATVNIDLHGRSDIAALARTKADGEYSGYLFKWAEGEEPASDVVFVLEGEYDRKYSLVRNEHGLLLRLPAGLVIVVR